MKSLLTAVLIVLYALPSRASDRSFAQAVKASLVFREDSESLNRGYPHVLKVFLHLENIQNSEVTWTADSVSGIEAELLDTENKPAAEPPAMAVDILSGYEFYVLPFGSSLDWLISHGGISMGDVGHEAGEKYALMVGGKGWLIPIATAGDYSLHIRLRGLPWTRTRDTLGKDDQTFPVLLDLPATKLNVTKIVDVEIGSP